MLRPYLSLKDFNPVADGVADDQPALQAMFDEGVRRDIYDFDVPAGDYAVGSNVLLPQSPIGVIWKKMRIMGNGAILRTLANDITIFDRSIADVSNISSTAYVPVIEGFSFRGQAANTATAGTGLRWDCAHGAMFRDLDFQNLATSFRAVWCMESVLQNCNAQGTLMAFEITNGDGATPGAHRIPGVPPGTNEGTHNNSNSNLFTIKHCHTQLTDATAIGIKMHAVGNGRIMNTTVEGSHCDIAVWIEQQSESGGVARRHIDVEHLWTEFTTQLNTVFKLNLRDGTVRLQLILPSRVGTTPNETVLIDDDDSNDSLIILRESDLYNWNGTTDPYFINVIKAAGDKNAYIFENNTVHPSTPDLTAAALWDNGTPAYISGRSWVRGTRFETF